MAAFGCKPLTAARTESAASRKCGDEATMGNGMGSSGPPLAKQMTTEQ